MFRGASSFNQDISSWDMTGVVYFDEMFSGAESFRQDLCAWGDQLNPVANVTNAFFNTACPNVGDPVLLVADGTRPGPFCFSCE